VRRALKWIAGIVFLLVVVGFCLFLYFIPPFFVTPPEGFSKPQNDAAPPITGITDPAERALAERGRYLVMTSGCIGCHHTPGPQGPRLEFYLSGGLEFHTREGTYVSRNLMSDKDTGLARRTDDEVKRVLRSGVFPDGHVVSYRVMPWGSYSSFTEEDRHAMVVYLRHMPAVRHQIPEPRRSQPLSDPLAIEEAYAGKDYGMGLRSTK
jgi:hypothetical protein